MRVELRHEFIEISSKKGTKSAFFCIFAPFFCIKKEKNRLFLGGFLFCNHGSLDTDTLKMAPKPSKPGAVPVRHGIDFG